MYKKTQGNPFFVNQLLVKLYKDGYISPVEVKEIGWDAPIDTDNLDEGGWMCDMEAIQAANYTSNVVDLMVTSLQALDVDAQHMLGIAATIGSQFDLALLARLCKVPELTVSIAFRPAVR